MRPKNAIAAPAAIQTDARANLRSTRQTAAAAQTMEESMKPWESAASPGS